MGLAFSSSSGWGASQKVGTVITSNTMTASSQTNQAIFRENVRMVQEDLVVLSDTMIVHFKEQGIAGSAIAGETTTQESKKEIKFIEAKDHVKIAKGESRAKCQHAFYDKQAEIIILRGAPVVWQGGTQVSGRKITMYLKEDRSVVEGETRVTIEPNEEK